jgi:hypothetical protein
MIDKKIVNKWFSVFFTFLFSYVPVLIIVTAYQHWFAPQISMDDVVKSSLVVAVLITVAILKRRHIGK